MGGAVGVVSEDGRREEENGSSSSSENSPFDWVLAGAGSPTVDLGGGVCVCVCVCTHIQNSPRRESKLMLLKKWFVRKNWIPPLTYTYYHTK